MRSLSGCVTGIALVNECKLYRLSGCLLNLTCKLGYLCALLLAYFAPSWTAISRQAGQAFHAKVDTDFTASWTAISREAGQ